VSVLEQAAPRADALTRARIELAEVLRRRSKLDEASSLAELALNASPPGATRARALMVLGRIRAAQGELARAERLLQQAYDLQLELEGRLAEMTLEAKSWLADVLITRGQSERAEPILREIVEDARKIYGDRHAEVGVALNNLANAISDFPEKRAEAARVYLEAAAILRVAKGPAHPEVGTTYNNLGALYITTQEWGKAEEVFRESIAIRSIALGPANPDTASAKHGRALALIKLQRYAEAEALLQESVAAFTASLGPGHWRTANARLYLGVVLVDQGKSEAGQPEMQAAYQIMASSLGENHPRVVRAREIMAQAAPSRK
jgi:tetratricopeptide (TPR) repeat protein